MMFPQEWIAQVCSLSTWSTTTLKLAALLALLPAYTLCLALYRITLHPLAKFPGPKLAASTYWYEYYHDVTKKGKFIWRIMEMHKQYGPVVRINPNELSISGPVHYSEIYHNNKWRTNRDSFWNLVHLGSALAFTVDHDLHAMRRQAMSQYFSMQSIRNLEPRITAVVQAMIDRLHQAHKENRVLNLHNVFAAYALDVVSEYAFGKQNSLNMMSNPEFGKQWSELTTDSVQINNFARQFPLMVRTMMSMPDWLLTKLNPSFALFQRWVTMLRTKVISVMQEDRNMKSSKESLTVFHDLLDSNLPPQEKSVARLTDEANMVVGAGGETTAQTLARTFFHLLDNRSVLDQLRAELKIAIRDPKIIPQLSTLQGLPYLNAVMEEGVRTAFAVPARMPRVFQAHVLDIDGWQIKPGIAVSMAPWLVLMNEDIFPEPFRFNPERWVDNKELRKYQVAFGKGRRACLGINLAYAELLFGIAMIVRNFELELHETTYERDVKVEHDFFVGLANLDSNGIRARVVKVLK